MTNAHKPIDDPAYQNHRVFLDLKEMAEFYKLFSFSVFSFITVGTGASCNIDSYLYSSIQGTIESIGLLIKNGRINDGYTLLRKYFDSIIINVYINLYLNDHQNLDSLTDRRVRDWIRGKEQMPEYRVMSQYIKAHPKLKQMNGLLYADETYYRQVRNRCNDHAHYNFYKNALLNDNEIYLEDRLKHLEVFSGDLRKIFVLHLSNIFLLNEHYMMSSDYQDSMEVGMTPEEGSQYFVAPFIQKAFNDFVKIDRPDLATLIKSQTAMQLE